MSQEEIRYWSKSTTKKFVIFGVPTLGTSIFMGFADVSLFFLYAEALLVAPFLVAVAQGLGKLTIAASQFFFGWISVAKYTKWGRRKPYLIILGPILSISYIFLLLPTLIIDFNDKNALLIWLIIWYQIFNLSYAVTTVYACWLTEQFSFDDRPKASQFTNTYNFIGIAIMTLFSMIILTEFKTKIQANPDIIPPEYLLSVLIFGILPVIFYYLNTFLMDTEPHFKIESSLFQNLKTILKNKNFVLTTVMIGIASLAWTQVGSLIIPFLENVLVFELIYYILAAGLFIIGILIFLYLWRRIVRRSGKKRSILFIFLSAIIFLPFTLLGLIQWDSNLIYGILFIIGIAGTIAGWYLLPPVFISDITEDDEKQTGELKAGIYKGFPSILLNIFQTVGLLIMGATIDFSPDVTVGTSTFSLGYILWGPICSLILVAALLFTRKFVQLDFDWEKRE